MKKRIFLILLALSVILFTGALAYAAQVDTDEEEVDTEDWLRIEGDGVALTLPLNFQGGNLEEVTELITDNLDMLGEEFEQFAPILEANPELFRFYAFDPDLLPTGGYTNVNITAVPLPIELDMADLLELAVGQYPEGFDVAESDVVELGEYEDVGRLLIEAEVMGFEQSLLQYTFLIDEVFYSITFTTAEDLFEDYLPIFEASAATFEIIEDK